MNELYLDNMQNAMRKIGLASDSIDNRFRQMESIGHCNEVMSMEKKGGGAVVGKDYYNPGVAPTIVADGKELAALAKAMMGDTNQAIFNIPSNGVELPQVTLWTTRYVKQLYKTTTLSKITSSWQQGAPGIMQIKIPTIGFNNVVDIYSDFSANGNSTINVPWVGFTIGYFETSLVWGDMQALQFGIAKLDYVNLLREASAVGISQFQNDLGFNGYSGIPSGDNPTIYGILNSPFLLPAISLPMDGLIPGSQTPTTEWEGKDFSQILRDVQLLVAQVESQGLGQVSTESKMQLILPPSAEAYLVTSTPYGVTVKDQLRKMFPNMEIVCCPNFESIDNESGQSVIMLQFADPESGEWTWQELFVSKMINHRPVPMHSSVSEKYSFGLGGAFPMRPLLITYAYGV